MALTGLLQRCPWLEGDPRPARCGGQGAAEHMMLLTSLASFTQSIDMLAIAATLELLGRAGQVAHRHCTVKFPSCKPCARRDCAKGALSCNVW